jgi:hypothetical protein
MSNSTRKQRRNTTHEILIDLYNYCPITMILQHTGLTGEQLLNAIEGEQNPEVYARLLSMWCLLETGELKNMQIKNALGELELRRAFDLSDNDKPSVTYANRNGA